MNSTKPPKKTNRKTKKVSPGLPPNLIDPDKLEHTDPDTLIRLNQYWSYDPRTHAIGLTSALMGIDHAKLEAQASAFAAEINAEGWTVMIDYSATGEGRHVWYLRVYGGTEEEAIKDFRRGFFADDDEKAWAFWSQGISVYRGAFWSDHIKGYKTPPDKLEMHWQSRF